MRAARNQWKPVSLANFMLMRARVATAMGWLVADTVFVRLYFGEQERLLGV